MAERISSPYYMHGHSYRVKLHDLDYGGAPFAPELQSMVTSDSANEYDETINTRNIELVFLYENSEAWIDLVNGLKTFDMDRFYITVELYRAGSWSFIFKGQVIQDLLTVPDALNSDLRIVANDGLALLKGLRCTGTLDGTEGFPYGFWRSMKNIFHYIFSNINTVINMYEDTDVVWTSNSSLEIDDSYYTADENIWETAWLSNYLNKDEPADQDGSYVSIYDALREVLDRLFLRISYDDGIYKITGKEQLQEDPQKNTFAYYKTGVLQSSTPPESFPTVTPIGTDPSDDVCAFDDGIETLKSGYREVTIVTNDQYNRLFQGEGINLKSRANDVDTSDNDLTVESTLTTEVGEVVPNEDYQIQFDVDVDVLAIYPGFEPIVLSTLFLIEIQSGSGGSWVKYAYPSTNPIKNYNDPLPLQAFEGFTYIALPLVQTHYSTVIKFTLPSASTFRKVRVRMLIENFRWSNTLAPLAPPGTYGGGALITVPYYYAELRSKLKMGPINATEPIGVYYYGKNDNKNPSGKRIGLLAGTKYPGPAARMITWNGSAGSPARVHADKYRFNSGDPFESIEDSMIRQILKYYGKPIVRLDLSVYGYVKTGDVVSFRDQEWYVFASTIDHLNHFTKLKLIKKNRLTLDFDIFLTTPKKNTNASALINDIIANSSLSSRVGVIPARFKFPDTNATEITIPYEIPEATVASYEISIRVEANGVDYYVDQVLSASKRQFFQVDWANNKLKFNITIKGYVVVWIYPYFDTNVASS